MIKKLINWIISFLHFSPEAIKMFRLANDISGLNKNTLPSELLPLNALQISRGLLNYIVIQSNLDWVLPYWAVKQFNPESLSFMPRSHLGLYMNLTERNWTAVGNPECNIEPIIDPRGMVTPFRNGWSVDIWLMVNDSVTLPSMASNTFQSLLNDLPIVETKIIIENGTYTTTAYTVISDLYINAEVQLNKNASSAIVFSIRPFNPEGISPIYSISFNFNTKSFTINNKESLLFDKKPTFVYCSNFKEGDAFNILKKTGTKTSADCEFGLSSAVAIFEFNNDTFKTACKISLESKNQNDKFYSFNDSIELWQNNLKRGTIINSPDDKINSLFKSSVTTLLMLLDGNTITPGPFTYHQFWIRDAVFMLDALDKVGYSDLTLNIINTFPSFQDSEGYFRSQKGEWDSNGQILWYVYRNALITGDFSSAGNLFDSLLKGAFWIDKFRLKDKKYSSDPFYGLLPAGISAEHLGLIDYYFWDNFWSLSGLLSFMSIQSMLKHHKNTPKINSLVHNYRIDLENALNKVQKKYCLNSIPASATRGIDCGMIGSICAAYPTQLFLQDDSRMINTLNTIVSKYFYKGMFFQNYIHSGMNVYLTLQIAHAYLYCGNRDKFWEILLAAVSNTTRTFNFPEAIHPLTGGGVMGDGHHGWAAAEVVLAIRDSFVYERFINSSDFAELVLLSGIPALWLEGRDSFSIINAPVASGIISIFVIPSTNCVTIKINFIKKSNFIQLKMHIILSLKFGDVIIDGNPVCSYYYKESQLNISPETKEIILHRN